MRNVALIAAFAGSLTAAALLGFAGPVRAGGIPPSPTAPGTDPPSICDAIAGNLVANCGFETGNFSSWTTTPAAAGSLFGVDGNPNSGTFAAFFGATVPPFVDTISQSIATIAGDAYTVSFFLANDGGGPALFDATFGSTTLLDFTGTNGFGYTQFTDTVVATGSSTLLSFASYQVPAFFFLDDISVVAAVPEPATLALLGGALVAFGVLRRRRGIV